MAKYAFALLCALPVFAADTDLKRLLDSVESRYNGARTLQVSFQESYTGTGRPKRTESGELYLRKPGRMRWEYAAPTGKLFVSDGKQLFYYNPATNRAEKMKLRESEDLRAPLAFLLGRLDFDKDFSATESRTEGSDVVVTAKPKSDKLPYKQVEFAVTSLKEIRRLVITAQDNSLLSFDFRNERMNPSLDDKLFKFVPPPGAAWEGAR